MSCPCAQYGLACICLNYPTEPHDPYCAVTWRDGMIWAAVVVVIAGIVMVFA